MLGGDSKIIFAIQPVLLIMIPYRIYRNLAVVLLLAVSFIIIAGCSQVGQTPVEPVRPITPLLPTPPKSQTDLIAFVGRNEQITSIGLMTSNGQNVRYVTDATGNDLLPKWSPDGQHIAYLSDRQVPLNEHGRQYYDLWLFSLSGEQSSRLTQVGQVFNYLTGFTWSPDSDKIMYSAPAFGVKVVDLIDLSTSTLEKHLRSPFAWSVKGELALSDSYIHPQAVFSLAILSSDYSPVLPPQEGFISGGHYSLNTATSLAWSPDGQQLAIGSYAASSEADKS